MDNEAVRRAILSLLFTQFLMRGLSLESRGVIATLVFETFPTLPSMHSTPRFQPVSD